MTFGGFMTFGGLVVCWLLVGVLLAANLFGDVYIKRIEKDIQDMEAEE